MRSLILLLDIDGTLVDTDAHLSNAMSALFKKNGVDFKPEEFFQAKTFPMPDKDGKMVVGTTMLFGAAWESSYYYLKSKNPPIDPGVEEFRKDIIRMVTSNHDGVVARQDVIDTVLSLREHCAQRSIGFAAIAVTNGARKEAVANLKIVKAAGLTVDALVNADDVPVANRKPHPMPYLKGHQIGLYMLESGGFDTKNVCVVALEDSSPGATSAVAAAEIYDGLCYYVPTTKRKMHMPELSDAGQERFFVQQDIDALGMHIQTQLHGRGGRVMPHMQRRCAV